MASVKLFLRILPFVVSALLAGCTLEKELSIEEGYVLDVDDNIMLVVKDISAEEFLEIDNLFVSGDPNSDFDGPDDVKLIYISYDEIRGIEKGDKVKVWVEGVDDSYPQQAKAEKISIQN